MLTQFHLPHYFSFHLKRQVKELYAAAAISDIAVSAMLIFEPVYMYQVLGLSVWQIMLFFALVYLVYIAAIPLGASFASRVGLKHGMIVSMPFQLLYWACLFFAGSVPSLIALGAIFYGLSKSFYWPSFHGVVAKFANGGQVGREFSALTAIIQVATVLGPLVGGFIAGRTGGGNLLLVSGIIYSLMIIPLIMHKERGERRPYRFGDTLKLYVKQSRKAIAYMGFGEELIAMTAWPVFIFLVAKSFEEMGVVVTIASGVAVIVSLWVGRLLDGGRKLDTLKKGVLLQVLVWLVRPVFPGAGGILLSATSGRVVRNAVFIPICTLTYERAEASDILPYVVFFEQSLAIGKFLTALIAALLFVATGGSFAVLFILAAVLTLLYLRL